MSKINTMNSRNNLQYITEKLFIELTNKTAEVIQGGWLMHAYDYYGGKGDHLAGANFYIEPKYGHRISSIYISGGEWEITSKDGVFTYELSPGINDLSHRISEMAGMLNHNIGSIRRVG